MALNVKPIFVSAPRNDAIKLTTAQTDVDGSGSTALFVADAVNGSRVHGISAVYTGSIASASVLRLFLYNSATYYVIGEMALPTYTAAAGVPAPVMDVMDSVILPYLDPADRYITLDAGDALYVSVLVTLAAAVHITAFGGDY